jgi:hypothetical protein
VDDFGYAVRKAFCHPVAKAQCTAVELLEQALCRQQFAGFGFGFVATAAGAVGVDLLGLASHGHKQAPEFLYQLAPNPPIEGT